MAGLWTLPHRPAQICSLLIHRHSFLRGRRVDRIKRHSGLFLTAPTTGSISEFPVSKRELRLSHNTTAHPVDRLTPPKASNRRGDWRDKGGQPSAILGNATMLQMHGDARRGAGQAKLWAKNLVLRSHSVTCWPCRTPAHVVPQVTFPKARGNKACFVNSHCADNYEEAFEAKTPLPDLRWTVPCRLARLTSQNQHRGDLG